MPERSLPRPFRRLLALVAPDPRVRELLEGDLIELHGERRAEIGRWRAAVRLLRDLLSLLPARAAVLRISAARVREHEPRSEDAMTNLLQDLKVALRTLGRVPAYSAVIVLTLALAIGANSAIFSVVDGVLLRPLPFEQPDDLFLVRELGPGDTAGEGPTASLSLFLAWRDSGQALDGIAMYSNQTTTLSGLAEPARLSGAAVSAALFPMLRAEAAIGRTFAADEETPGRDRVVILGQRAWQRYFAADSAVVGAEIRMDEGSRTVIGVMPAEFRFPDAETDYWVPMITAVPEGGDEDALAAAERTQQRVERRVEARREGPGPGGGDAPEPEVHSIEMWGRVLARLAPGVTPEMADDEATRILAGVREAETLPEGGERGVEMVSLLQQLVGSVRQPLLLLMGAVAFVLLIACANVINLVMARSLGRHRKTAVRASLGAGWWRLARFLLVESAVLSLGGAVLGLGLAWAGLRALTALGPDFIPRMEGVSIDLRVLAFTALVTAATAILTCLVPMRHAARLDLTRALKDDSASSGTALGSGATRQLLVMVETAAAVVMLVGAGLLVSSFLRLTTIDHGYRPDDLLQVQLQLPASAYPDAPAHRNAMGRVMDRLGGVPTVEAATVASRTPSQPANIRIGIQVRDADGTPVVGGEPQPVGIRVVDGDYFETIGARLLAGRFLGPEDRAETTPVMVLSESAAMALLGRRDGIVGQRMRLIAGEAEIAGVVADVRTAGVDPVPQPDVFIPYTQAPDRMLPMLFQVANLLIRSDGEPLQAAAQLRDVLRQAAPDGLVLSVVPVRDTLADAVAEPRFYASLVGGFAALALALAAVGIYGLLAYSVQQGMRDTAIRRALGAPVDRILRGVLVRGMVLAGIGLAVGVGLSLALGRVLESMLYEVEPGSPATLASVAVLFLAVAAAAVWIPARRAARVDPMEVLRGEI